MTEEEYQKKNLHSIIFILKHNKEIAIFNTYEFTFYYIYIKTWYINRNIIPTKIYILLYLY